MQILNLSNEQIFLLKNYKCPKCEADLHYIKGKPDFIGCIKYPNCDYKISAEAYILFLRRLISTMNSKIIK